MALNHAIARSPLLLLALLLCSPASSQTVQVSSAAASDAFTAAIQRFETQIATDVAADDVGSITAAVALGNSVVWAKSFGYADSESRELAGVETIYRTGSISKTFTALLLLQLVERGVVALDDPVVMHLSEFTQIQGPPEQVRSITLRQLASHTGGLIREPELPLAASGPISEWQSKVLASIATTSLQSVPGSEYSYSNIGFGILGLTLSRAAGRPFMDLVTELIFEPLGMRHSTFHIDARSRAIHVGRVRSQWRWNGGRRVSRSRTRWKGIQSAKWWCLLHGGRSDQVCCRSQWRFAVHRPVGEGKARDAGHSDTRRLYSRLRARPFDTHRG